MADAGATEIILGVSENATAAVIVSKIRLLLFNFRF